MEKQKVTEAQLIELSKLRWHCRRGMKELDVVFTYYLENHYLTSNDEAQKAFREIMMMEDPIVIDLIMGLTLLENSLQNQVITLMKKPQSQI